MPLHEHGLDGFSVTAGTQYPIPHAPGKIHRRIVISMGLEAAHLTAERPLIGSVCAVGVMAHATLLGTVRADDRGGLHPTFLTNLLLSRFRRPVKVKSQLFAHSKWTGLR
jgi:hypothetical protein